jgi:hypothetical protein
MEHCLKWDDGIGCEIRLAELVRVEEKKEMGWQKGTNALPECLAGWPQSSFSFF